MLGLFNIFATAVLAILSDRLAHRQRLAAMSQAFECAITLPISYHSERGSGAEYFELFLCVVAFFLERAPDGDNRAYSFGACDARHRQAACGSTGHVGGFVSSSRTIL